MSLEASVDNTGREIGLLAMVDGVMRELTGNSGFSIADLFGACSVTFTGFSISTSQNDKTFDLSNKKCLAACIYSSMINEEYLVIIFPQLGFSCVYSYDNNGTKCGRIEYGSFSFTENPRYSNYNYSEYLADQKKFSCHFRDGSTSYYGKIFIIS